MTIIPVGRLAHPIKTMLSVKRKSKISDVITSLEKYKKEKRNGCDLNQTNEKKYPLNGVVPLVDKSEAISSSDWLVVEIYNNRIHKIFMATDNTSDISENDIIVAFELKNNSNPLAIYLEYQSKFYFFILYSYHRLVHRLVHRMVHRLGHRLCPWFVVRFKAYWFKRKWTRGPWANLIICVWPWTSDAG